MDILFKVIEVVSAGFSAYIVLLQEEIDKALIVFLLITTVLASSMRDILSLKHTRRAYSKAFKTLENGLDKYRAEKDKKNANVLVDANKQAQDYIADIYE